jgi:hypothetical protein
VGDFAVRDEDEEDDSASEFFAPPAAALTADVDGVSCQTCGGFVECTSGWSSSALTAFISCRVLVRPPSSSLLTLGAVCKRTFPSTLLAGRAMYHIVTDSRPARTLSSAAT